MTALALGGLGCTTPLRLVGEDAEALAAALRAVWTRCPARPDEPESEAVEADAAAERDPAADPAATSPDSVRALLPALTQKITYAKIAAQAGRLLMLHAGAVAHPVTGCTVGFVAPGGTGKTTLTGQLARRYGYVTDETLGVTLERAVVPYPKPLSVRPALPGAKSEFSPDELGLAQPPDVCTLRRLVLLARRDDHTGPPEVEELGVMAALEALTPETSSLEALPRPLHTVAGLLDGLHPTVRLHYRDVGDIEALIDGWLADR